MKDTTILFPLLLSLATAIPQTVQTIKLVTFHNVRDANGKIVQPGWESWGTLNDCVEYNFPSLDLEYAEIADGLSCDFFSERGCSGSRVNGVGTNRRGRKGGNEPKFKSYVCDKRQGRGRPPHI
jgi:hypothetical protein